MPKSCKDEKSIVSMVIKEHERLLKPKESNYKEATNLLDDFGIKTKIPRFKTIGELNNFTKQQIHSYL